jgi:hypothetical protein
MITPSNSSLFPEYLIPNLKHLINDPSEFVRATLGKCIGPLALTSKRFLNLTQVINQRKRMECDTNQMTPGDPVDTIEVEFFDDFSSSHDSWATKAGCVDPLLSHRTIIISTNFTDNSKK